jgi:RimJ/RimL family protein N-acetyltransferase
VCKVRNHPDLQRWFRQDEDLTFLQEQHFIRDAKWYHGYIIEVSGQPVGVCGLVEDREGREKALEFGIAVLPEFQQKGIATKAMQLLQQLAGKKCVYSEVFVDNPALSWYLHKLGFKAVSVRERAYYKKGVGLVDVVRIEWGHA